MLALARQHPSFAGMFFEPGTDRLVVASTSTDVSDVAAVRQTVLTAVGTELGRSPAAGDALALNAVHRIFEYSFLELARHRARIRSQVFGIPGVQSLSVNEQHNRIKIGLSDMSARVRVEELAADLAIPIEMLSFAQASPAVPLVGDSRSPLPRPAASSGVPTLRDVISVPDDKLRGGYMVQAEGVRDEDVCTLGFTASSGVFNKSYIPTYFVTASHCSRYTFFLDNGIWNQPDNKRGPERKDPEHKQFPRGVGQEAKDPEPHSCRDRYGYGRCRRSDASLIATHFPLDYGHNVIMPRGVAIGDIGRTTERSSCRSCEISVAIDTVNPVIRIVATRDYIIVGEELDKVGVRTGWTYGDVEETCVDYDNWWDRVRMLCNGKIRLKAGNNDSGAPVFQYDSIAGSARLVGILWGKEIGVALISNFGNIKHDLIGGIGFPGGGLLVCDLLKRCDDDKK